MKLVQIRKIEINHFRGIKDFSWLPSEGINCLIGSGDAGKSTVLDAIDFCLNSRRSIQFSDADFYNLDVETPIEILVTIGDLQEELKNIDVYGLFLRGFRSETGEIEDEPEVGTETVITLKLSVASDLEPVRNLYSLRADEQGTPKNLTYKHRAGISPTRIGVMASYHFGWKQGSVLNRVSDAKADASEALAKAAREARLSFGDESNEKLSETLEIVETTAKELGIPIGEKLKAMLDTKSVSFTGGALSLHDQKGVPLKSLGVGSSRLLVAGLQKKAAPHSAIILIDELEYGLEPHRIIRLLNSLGAKDTETNLQVFMTTHSPAALRELSGNQLYILSGSGDGNTVKNVGTENDIQSAIRLYPEAFLAQSILVCEGASEVGFVRGIDRYRTDNGSQSIAAQGVALIDCGGGDSDRPYVRAKAMQSLGYRTALLRDDDIKPSEEIAKSYHECNGRVFKWNEGRAIEDEIFISIRDSAVDKLIEYAKTLHGESLIDQHIKSASSNKYDLQKVKAGSYDLEVRQLLAKSSKAKKKGWFKSVTAMEHVAYDIVGPDLKYCPTDFTGIVKNLFKWASDA